MTYRSFSKRQLLAMTWWNRKRLCDRDAIICDGAVRSGKTFSLCCGFFLWSMTSFDGAVFALCGKTVSSLRRNIVIHLQSWLGGLFTVTEHRQDNCLTVRFGDRVNTYYLFGGQDEQSYTLIQGITLAGALLDEVVLMPRSFVEQAVARCSEPGSKMWFSCNPASKEHWFYQEWVCKAVSKNALYLHFTMDDNPGLSPKIRARYARLYTGLFYRRYVLGQWCKAEGLVYEFDETRHLCHDPPEGGRWYISVDYGTRNPFSAGLWCVTTQMPCHSDPEHSEGEESPSVGGILRRCVPQDDRRTEGERIPRDARNDNVGATIGRPYGCGKETGGRAMLAPTMRGKVAIRVKEYYYSGRDTGRMMTDEEYTPGEAKREKKTTGAVIMGGSFQIDRVLQNTAGAADEMAFQAEQKIKATANFFHNMAINGDSTNGGFDGLKKLLSGSANELVSQVSLQTSSELDENYNAFLDEMDAFLATLDGSPDLLLMNTQMLIKLRSIARRAGYYERSTDDFGSVVETYAGIPMVDMGKYFDGETSVDVIPTEEGKTAIYAVCLGLDGFHGISPMGTGVIQSYLPDLNAPGAVKTGEVELVAGVALKNTLKAAVLKGIAIGQ